MPRDAVSRTANFGPVIFRTAKITDISQHVCVAEFRTQNMSRVLYTVLFFFLYTVLYTCRVGFVHTNRNVFLRVQIRQPDEIFPSVKFPGENILGCMQGS